jgi:hypothetical protein
MASISVQNETVYTVTDTIAQHICRDAQEYFGDAVRVIRVQDGLARHAFNVRTGEVRYAFSPQDFGLVMTPTAVPPVDDNTEEESLLRPIAGQPGGRGRRRRRQ